MAFTKSSGARVAKTRSGKGFNVLHGTTGKKIGGPFKTKAAAQKDASATRKRNMSSTARSRTNRRKHGK